MNTLYTVILASGLFTNGLSSSTIPMPMTPQDCFEVATHIKMAWDGRARCENILTPNGKGFIIGEPQ